MDINRVTGTSQPLVSLAVSQQLRQEAPQAPAAAPPAAPSDGVRVTAPEQAHTATANEVQLKRSLDAINRFLKPATGDIEFSMDEETGKTVIKIVDNKTNTVLRQIPSEEVLEIAKQLDRLQGLLVKDKV